MNKIIEESIRDKNYIDELQKIIENKDKQSKKKQRKIDSQEEMINEFERELRLYGEKFKNDFEKE